MENDPASLINTAELTVHSRIALLHKYLGDGITMLAWPSRTKGTAQKWHAIAITPQRLAGPGYLAALEERNVNIGVKAGTPSQELGMLDLDNNCAVGLVVALNPPLAATFRTIGARGCQFWFRVVGVVPPTTTLKDSAGHPAGEWRWTGSQSIGAGVHPSGRGYRILPRHAIVLSFQALRWPRGWTSARFDPTTGEARRAPSASPFDGGEERECGRVLAALDPAWSAQAVAWVIQGTVASGPKRNHLSIHRLNRRIKGFEQTHNLTLGHDVRLAVFEHWYRASLAAGVLDPAQSRDAYLREFFSSGRVSQGETGVDPTDIVALASARASQSERIECRCFIAAIRSKRSPGVRRECPVFFLKCRAAPGLGPVHARRHPAGIAGWQWTQTLAPPPLSPQRRRGQSHSATHRADWQ